MPDITKCLLGCFTGALAVLILWGFLRLNISISIALTCIIILWVTSGCIYLLWHRHSRSQLDNASGWSLPEAGFDGMLVLLCGDSRLLFSTTAQASEQPEPRKIRQGWYLATPEPEDFMQAIKWIAAVAPDRLSQLSIVLCIAPEQHNDEAKFRAVIHLWRRRINESRRWLPAAPPILLCAYLNPLSTTMPCSGQWFVHESALNSRQQSIIRVQSADGSGIDIAAWQQLQSGGIGQILWLNTLTDWLNTVVIDELLQTQQSTPVINVTAVAINFSSLQSVENNLWQHRLTDKTTLSISARTFKSNGLPFPDCLLPMLRQPAVLSPMQRFILTSGGIVALALMAMMLASYANNKKFIHAISDDLRVYKHLSGTPPEHKILAQRQLRDDEQQITRHQIEGVPLSLSMALYQGGNLRLPIQQAIGNWTAPVISPPPVPIKPVPQPTPQTYRLSSLALFDIGKSQLKPDSAKLLTNVLVSLKVSSGWLIEISGHTDTTGNSLFNQKLSVKRAEALRDWILANSDLSPNAFSIQGLGSSQPIATNDTPLGRARNRRVEIRQVPGYDTLQALVPPSSSGNDAGITTHKEK